MSTKPIKNMNDAGVIYYENFPDWVKKKYYSTTKGVCQLCNKYTVFKDMQFHRIKRGHEGGLYTLCKLDHPKQNVKIICKGCHQVLHSNEFGHVSHSY